MTVPEIAALPVDDWAADDAVLFMWTTNRYLADSFGIVAAWGFRHVATLVWCKQHGRGSGGVFYSNVEFILYCKRGNPTTPTRLGTRWFTWPRSSHSAKPEAFLDTAEMVGAEQRLEMFSRRARMGWATWGNESLHGGEAA